MTSLEQIPSIDDLVSRANQALGFKRSVEQQLEITEKEVKRLTAEEEILVLTSKMLRTLMDLEVNEAREAVEKLLTDGLQSVFNDQDLAVRADVEESRGKVSMNIVTVEKHDGGYSTEGPAISSNGGAVASVQSVLMRIITTMKRDLRNILVLDETLSAFHRTYIPGMMEFLTTMCERLGFDIVVVTHNDLVPGYASTAYDVRKARGRAKISKTV